MGLKKQAAVPALIPLGLVPLAQAVTANTDLATGRIVDRDSFQRHQDLLNSKDLDGKTVAVQLHTIFKVPRDAQDIPFGPIRAFRPTT